VLPAKRPCGVCVPPIAVSESRVEVFRRADRGGGNLSPVRERALDALRVLPYPRYVLAYVPDGGGFRVSQSIDGLLGSFARRFTSAGSSLAAFKVSTGITLDRVQIACAQGAIAASTHARIAVHASACSAVTRR
jgi:hypothetical protein